MLECAAKAVAARAAVTVDYEQKPPEVTVVIISSSCAGAGAGAGRAVLVAAGSVRRREMHLFAVAGRTICCRYQPRDESEEYG